MCERCDDPALDWTKWERVEPGGSDGPEEDLPTCDYIPEGPADGADSGTAPDDEGPSCGEPATWVQVWTTPVDHLCPQHKQEREEDWTNEHGRVPPPLGLESFDRFLSIEGEEPCEELTDEDEACRTPAAWVELDSLRSYSCEDHRATEA